MLILKNISKQYEGCKEKTLNNINITFPEKGMYAILGNSGCGKSTLLNIIAGLDSPSSGSVLLDGCDITKLRGKKLNYYHGKYLGFVYQNYNLINYLNVVDNIELINKNNNLEKLLMTLKLSDKKKRQVKDLSGGERQRVAIARALSNNPHILLCDEPTGALDTKTSNEIMNLLKDISTKILVIVVTHNNDLAKSYADHIIYMKDGNIQFDNNKKIKNSKVNFIPEKHCILKTKILNIITKNILSKYKRNILSIIAFSIGLISLALVLGISSGFNKSIEYEEKNSLSKYPIYISETSANMDDAFKEIFATEENLKDDYIYSTTSEHKNKLTKEYIKNLNTINEFLNYRIMTYLIDDKIINTSSSSIAELNVIYGRNIENKNECLLFVNNNKIESFVLNSIGLTDNQYHYSEVLNKKIKIAKNEIEIVGIVSPKEDSFFESMNGFFLINSNFENEIPISIMLYPRDYESKKSILDHLNKNPDIQYTDYSTTIKNVSKTIINGVSIVLICFSVIALIVSTIMIGIIAYISVIERIKEIGLLKSLGVSNLYIKIIFIGESVILGIIASLISLGITKVISISINKIFYNLTGMKDIILVNLSLVSTITIIGISLSIIGSYFPIRKSKKIKITECLKYE